jgi:hypothetical protein
MTPSKTALCNDTLHPAPGDEAHVLPLPIHRTEDGLTTTSFWYPDEAELSAINQGNPILLIAHSPTHPPVSIEVLAPPTEDADSQTITADLLYSIWGRAKANKLTFDQIATVAAGLLANIVIHTQSNTHQLIAYVHRRLLRQLNLTAPATRKRRSGG